MKDTLPFKIIFVSGGVISGLGKGVTVASLGSLLQEAGYSVTALKCDMYLNIDAGTMNPLEHGEVFVTVDGLETDQDLGHYERFLNINLGRNNYVTRGQMYWNILNKERQLVYQGKCVEDLYEIPREFSQVIDKCARESKADIVIVELGGTVGEYQSAFIFEGIRKLKLSYPADIALVHVGYLPAPAVLGELKSKPLQSSVIELYRLGLQPDFIVCRGEKSVDAKRIEKISNATGVPSENIIDNPDLNSIYKLPALFKKQSFDDKILQKLSLVARKKGKSFWENYQKKMEISFASSKIVKIGIIGKYQKTGDYLLVDSYVCVVEALRHACFSLGVRLELVWINAEGLENQRNLSNLGSLSGIIVPQGWGNRGSKGKLVAIKYARENKLPYLGLCFGMQHAVIEFARTVYGLKDANSTEVDSKTPHPVIHIMPDQEELLKKQQYGGTIRLGQWPCKVSRGSLLDEVYGSRTVLERHRHRYEFNNSYREILTSRGLIISGTSPDGKIVEAVELSKKDHPFFLGVQFHPEYQSRPKTPHPIFVGFIKASLEITND
ncbi:CTP synthase [Candidatus Parcubacteria bacterium]|nr:CTP synthase [Patescibacteria group bacterium]MCG2689221.1 CTP synthase [Candidatus Parcubacteria bacterium]